MGEALRMAMVEDNLLPAAGVAVPLSKAVGSKSQGGKGRSQRRRTKLTTKTDNLIETKEGSDGVLTVAKHSTLCFLSRSDSAQYVPLPVLHPDDGERHHGTIFTYLPLPIHSGLPVHINGAFAVTSNRRHLCERNEDGEFRHWVIFQGL